MKQWILLIIFTLNFSVLFGQFVIFPDENIYEEYKNGLSVYKWTNDNKKVSGKFQLSCLYDWEGLIYCNCEGKGQFIDGLMHGKWELERCSRMGVKQEINYNHGQIAGHYKVFVVDFGSDTTMLYETDFIKGTGIWQDFYGHFHDYSIYETGFYKNGKKMGEWCYYTEKGSFIYRKKHYKNGILVKEEDFEIPEEYEPCPRH